MSMIHTADSYTLLINNNRHIGPYDTETLSTALEASSGPR